MNAPIVAVTVLEDRAAVTRRGTCVIEPGQHRATIELVSPILVDKTLTATATGARVLDVRCERYLAQASGSSEPVALLRVQRAELERDRDALAARAHAASIEVTELGAVVEAGWRDLAIAAARGVQAVAAAEQLAELDRLESDARARSIEAELAASEATRSLDRLDARIARTEAQAGNEAARLVIDLVAEAAGEAVVTIGYVVPGAAWRPYHRAVLARSLDGDRVDWRTTACVWQATGEDWIDAALTFSLERPSLGVEPPDLGDDELRARRRPDTVVVEARDQHHQTAGLGGTGPAEVPGIDDGGLGLVVSAPNATIRADGTPHRVAVGGFASEAQLVLIAIPLRSPWVHLRASVVNTGTAPLLAGPVDLIMSSGYVGRTEIGFVAPGEKLQIGFGPESDVRIHRSESRELDEAGLLGGWNVQTVRVAVRLSNLGATAREVVVTERVPISEIEQVEVTAAAPGAYRLGADDQPGGEEVTQVIARTLDARGMVTWTVELPPLGRRAVALEYRVKSQRGVTGI